MRFFRKITIRCLPKSLMCFRCTSGRNLLLYLILTNLVVRRFRKTMDRLSARGNDVALTVDAHDSSRKNNCVEERYCLEWNCIACQMQRNYATTGDESDDTSQYLKCIAPISGVRDSSLRGFRGYISDWHSRLARGTRHDFQFNQMRQPMA